jgi:hypothetical protein
VSNITTLKPLPHLPADLPDRLRRLVDDVEAGRVTSMVVAYVYDGAYEFLWPSSLVDSMTLTTLAQASAIDRMRR